MEIEESISLKVHPNPPSSFKFIMSEISNCLTKDSIFLFTTKGEFDVKKDGILLDNGFW